MANNQGNYTNKFPDKQNRGKGTGRTPGEKIKAFFSSSSKKTDPVKTKLRGKSVAKAATPKKIVKKKDTKEAKRKTSERKVAQTKSAGYGGSVKQADGPQQSKKGYFGSNTTRLKAEADKGKAKKSAPSRTVAKDKKKPKKDEFSFQKAINKGFGRVY